MPFILFDTETTGNAENDRICQIAIGELKKDGCDYSIDYCKPPVKIDFFAMAVHGITEEDVANKPVFNEAPTAKKLQDLNKSNSIIIAHNAKFDIGMIRKEGVEWIGGVIDTFRCSKHLINSESHALQYLRYSLGLYKTEKDEEAIRLKEEFGDMMNPHNALFDIYILKKLLFHLIGITDDYKKLIELTATPILLKTMRFGKYKNETFETIAKKDGAYLRWLRDNKQDMDEDLEYTLNYYA